ncbi:hypothetical protein SAY87_021658 [Trapa incisa]|uniref:Uncharacterized protein n=1 Tax=Trapa incisa TaxID=236973 RepID=A0AAN7JTX3_9MYRT|nr:hypothetical protein SAY87_021658 [Trapa incisa]
MDKGESWADQWDNDANPLPASDGKKSGLPLTVAKYKQKIGQRLSKSKTVVKYKQKIRGLAKSKWAIMYKQKMREGLVKTKRAASLGLKKMKEGTLVGIRWMKIKYEKATQKN